MRKRIHDMAGMLLAVYLMLLAILILPGFLGIYVQTVTSGSMEPAIHTGSVVYACPVAYSEIKEGDIITFLIDKKGTRVTHRVVRIEQTEDGTVCCRTRGDANEAEDAKRTRIQNVLGVVRLSIPYMGILAARLSTLQGKISLILVLLGFLAVSGITREEKVSHCMAGKTEKTKTEKAKTEKAKTEKAKAEKAKTEEAKTEEAKTDREKGEENEKIWKSSDHSC